MHLEIGVGGITALTEPLTGLGVLQPVSSHSVAEGCFRYVIVGKMYAAWEVGWSRTGISSIILMIVTLFKQKRVQNTQIW